MNTVQTPELNIVEEAPLQLQMWWHDLDQDGKEWVGKQLGALVDVMKVKPRDDLIKALVTFWDPVHNVFRFSDFELTPTLEEIAGYAGSGRDLRNQQLIFPRPMSVRRFFEFLSISRQLSKNRVIDGCCSFYFLYSRYGFPDGFEIHEKGLTNKQDKEIWKVHRRTAFIVAFLGVMIFPNAKGTIDVRVARIAQVLTEKKDHTLAPLILSDIYRALTECKSGKTFFEGCNIILQMWLIEHLRHHPRFMSYGPDKSNLIGSYEERIKDYHSPEGVEAWIEHLKNLRAEQIEWTLGWLPVREIIHMSATKNHLLLMGLKSVQPYAPQRVLRQLGRYQIVPEDEDLSTQVIELHPEAPLPEALIQQSWSGCRYLKEDTQVPNLARGEVDPGYARWFEKRNCANEKSEPESQRPPKRPHVQAFDDKIQERLAWGEKEKEYQTTIHALKEKLRNLEFNNELQAQVVESEKRQLTQENEVLQAQIRNLKIAAETPMRSERDEKIISNLRTKVHEYAFDLAKAEKDLSDTKNKLAKGAEEQAHHLRQKYGKEMAILKEKLFTMGNEMIKQAKDFRIEREYCYAQVGQLEGIIQELQDQNNRDAQVLEARSQQIGRLLQEKGVIRNRIKEIADYVVQKCHECENMTVSMFFATMMIFVHQVMDDLERLQEDIAHRPAPRPANAPQAPRRQPEALLYY